MRAMARSSWDTAVMALEIPGVMWVGIRLWFWWSFVGSLDAATLVEPALADFFFWPALGLFLTCEYLAGIVVVALAVVVVGDEDQRRTLSCRL